MGYSGLVTLHFFWQPVTVINFSDIDETMESVNKIDIHEGDGTTEATALWKILNDKYFNQLKVNYSYLWSEHPLSVGFVKILCHSIVVLSNLNVFYYPQSS